MAPQALHDQVPVIDLEAGRLAGLDRLVQDRGRPDLDAGERAGRAAAASLLVGTAIGGAVGAKIKGWSF